MHHQVRKGLKRYAAIGIRLAGFLTLRPRGEWGVHEVQPIMQCPA